MMNTQKRLWHVLLGFALTFGLWLCASLPTQLVHATGDYSITVVKYGATNNSTNYSPMSGVTYHVQPITATGSAKPSISDPTSYSVVSQDFQTIVTGSDGTAKLSDLAQGDYLVTEVASQTVINPMSPVIVTLPTSDGDPNSVVIYPKSNVVPPNETPTPPTPTTTTTGYRPPLPSTFPQTSGDTTTSWPFLVILALMVVAGAGYVWQTRKHH